MAKQLTIALVACEESGDYLGSKLMEELKKKLPQVSFVGVGGRKMQQQGLDSYFPMEKLTAMGISEILFRLPQLWYIRRRIKSLILGDEADLFIGIDAPDFNLGLAQQLKQLGMKTVHYVSPTIWAWRPGRIHKVKKAVDLVLCLYPFEPKYYHNEKIPAIYVGHPLADNIAINNDKHSARQQIYRQNKAIKLDGQCVALLPGSRTSELRHLAELFIQTALQCLKQVPSLQFLIATTSTKHQLYLKQLLDKYNLTKDRFHISIGDSHTVMAAADTVLLASGTASLECLLIKRPMVIAYKVSSISYWILAKMLKLNYVSQPNWLYDGELVEEYIQYRATVGNLAPALLKLLNNPPAHLQQAYSRIHHRLRKNASVQVAQAIENLLAGAVR